MGPVLLGVILFYVGFAAIWMGVTLAERRTRRGGQPGPAGRWLGPFLPRSVADEAEEWLRGR